MHPVRAHIANINFWDRVTALKHVVLHDTLDNIDLSNDFQFFSDVDGWGSSKITLVGAHTINPDGTLTVNNNTEIRLNVLNNDVMRHIRIWRSPGANVTASIDGTSSVTLRQSYSDGGVIKTFIRFQGTLTITRLAVKSLNSDGFSLNNIHVGSVVSACQNLGYVAFNGNFILNSTRHAKRGWIHFLRVRNLIEQSYGTIGKASDLVKEMVLDTKAWQLRRTFTGTSYLAQQLTSYRSNDWGRAVENIQLVEIRPAFISGYILAFQNNTVARDIVINVKEGTRANTAPSYDNRLMLGLTSSHSNYWIYFLEELSRCRQLLIESNSTLGGGGVVNLFTDLDWDKANFVELISILVGTLPYSRMQLHKITESMFLQSNPTKTVEFHLNTVEVYQEHDLTRLGFVTSFACQFRFSLNTSVALKITMPETLNVSLFRFGQVQSPTGNRVDNDVVFPTKITALNTGFQYIVGFMKNLADLPEIDLSAITTNFPISVFVYLEPVGQAMNVVRLPEHPLPGAMNLGIYLFGGTYANPKWDGDLKLVNLQSLDDGFTLLNREHTLSLYGSSGTQLELNQDLVNKMYLFSVLVFGTISIKNLNIQPLKSNLRRFIGVSSLIVTENKTYEDRFMFPQSNLHYFGVAGHTFFAWVDFSNIDFRDVDSDSFLMNTAFRPNAPMVVNSNIYMFKTTFDPSKENNHSFRDLGGLHYLNALDLPIGDVLIFMTYQMGLSSTTYSGYVEAYCLKKIYDNALKFKPRPANPLQDTASYAKTITAIASLIRSTYNTPDGYVQADSVTPGDDGVVKYPPRAMMDVTGVNINIVTASNFTFNAVFNDTGTVPGSLKVRVFNGGVPFPNVAVILVEDCAYGYLRAAQYTATYSSLISGSNFAGDLQHLTNINGEAEFIILRQAKYHILMFEVVDITTIINNPIMTGKVEVVGSTVVDFEVSDYKKVSINHTLQCTFDATASTSTVWTLEVNGRLIDSNDILAQRYAYFKTGDNDITVWAAVNVLGYSNAFLVRKTFVYNYDGVSTTITLNIGSETVNDYYFNAINETAINSTGRIVSEYNNFSLYTTLGPGQYSTVRHIKKNERVTYFVYYSASSLFLSFEVTSDNMNKEFRFKGPGSYATIYSSNSNYNMLWKGGILAIYCRYLLYKDFGDGDELVFATEGSGNELYVNSLMQGITKVVCLTHSGNVQVVSQYCKILAFQNKDYTNTLKYRWSIS